MVQAWISDFCIFFFSRCRSAERPGKGVRAFDETGSSRGNLLQNNVYDIDTLRTVPAGIGLPGASPETSMPFREVEP